MKKMNNRCEMNSFCEQYGNALLRVSSNSKNKKAANKSRKKILLPKETTLEK